MAMPFRWVMLSLLGLLLSVTVSVGPHKSSGLSQEIGEPGPVVYLLEQSIRQEAAAV